MIVDDDPDILLSVKQLLEACGYKVYQFDNGRDFLEALNKGKKPSLIILDITMPIMSGWEIRKRLEENPRWKSIPVVFLTGRTNETAEDMYEQYGVDHIKKPFSIKDFIESIERILDSRRKYSRQMSKCAFYG